MDYGTTAKNRTVKSFVSLGASIFLGLTLLASGSGKVHGQAEFMDALFQSFWSPTLAYFIGYCLPWVEIALGTLLLLGMFPRIVAALCLPLTAGFMANNSVALSQGVEQFPSCTYCFGRWEEFLGAMSPLQALCLDIVLFCLALVIILFHDNKFLHFRPWFAKTKGRSSNGINFVQTK